MIGDLSHILLRSKVGAEISFARCHGIPTHAYLDATWARQALLAGGDDYELCFTRPGDQRKTIEASSKRLEFTADRYRRNCFGPDLIVRDGNGAVLDLDSKAFDHFRYKLAAFPSAFLRQHPAHFFAFGFGSGLVPFAPGTAGTLVAYPIFFFALFRRSVWLQLIVVAVLFALGVWACAITGRI